MIRAAYAMCGSREDAEDLVQETFERVLAGHASSSATATSRTCSALCVTPAAPMREPGTPPHRAIAAGGSRVDRRRASRPVLAMDAQLAYAAMAELSEPLRATIVAVDVVGLSYKEAARSLRTRVGTIMSRLYRAREQVAAAMEAP